MLVGVIGPAAHGFMHVPHMHALHGRDSVPDTSFNAGGYNTGTYSWAPTSQVGVDGHPIVVYNVDRHVCTRSHIQM